MQVVLPYVATLNNKITKGDDANPSHWSSKEDQEFFGDLKKNAKLVIRSSKTYLASKLSDPPRPGRLVVVLTREPDKYSADQVPGQLEFTNESPMELVARLASAGHEQALLSVGGNASAQFIKDGLVDDFYLTLEPLMFGQGVNMIGDGDFEAKFSLVEVKQLNTSGTVWLHYKLVK